MRDASVWMQAFGQMEAVDLDAFEAFLTNEGISVADPPKDLDDAREA